MYAYSLLDEYGCYKSVRFCYKEKEEDFLEAPPYLDPWLVWPPGDLLFCWEVWKELLAFYEVLWLVKYGAADGLVYLTRKGECYYGCYYLNDSIIFLLLFIIN